MKQKYLVVLLLFSFVISLSGTAAAQQDVTISMWTHDNQYIEFFTARAEEWKQNYPDINFTFDFQVVPDVFTVSLANLAAGEDMPDMIGLEQGSFPRFMEGGIIADKFVDLTDLIGDQRESIIEGRWTPYMYEGRIYGLESGLGAVVYYYQPEILEKYGVNVPTTWNEFLQVGATLAQNGVRITPLTDDAQANFMMYFSERGGQLFDAEGNFIFGDEPNRQYALDVLNLIQQGLDAGIYYMSLGGDYWGPAPYVEYREGRLAGIVMPDWYSDYMLKPQAEDMAGKWRVTTMPRWDDGTGYSTSAWGGVGFAILKDSEHVDLVWDFLQYSYLNVENQIKRYEEINYTPVMPAAYDDPRVIAREDPYYGGQTTGAIYANIILDMPIWYQSPYRSVFFQAMTAELPRFFNGEVTAEELIDNVISTVEDEIAFGS